MSTKHTPGPWVVCTQDGDHYANTIFAESQLCDGLIEAKAWDSHVASAGLDHKNFEANARLIAAAPDLLSVLIEFVGSASVEMHHPKKFAAACKAIAKAAGSQP